MGTRIAVDIGGTFTDLVLESESGTEVSKVLTLSLIHILRAHETPEHLVCRLLLEKKKTKEVETV
jgi:N-methylhydantoinase A/oxoprolinase/acetone carboxylase beta subunit